MGVIEDVREQYPTLSFLLNDPEVGPLLRDAVDPNKGFSPQTFQAKLYQTRWWRARSQTQREFDILSNTDPGTAKQNINNFKQNILSMATRLGVRIRQSEADWIAASALRGGWAPDDPRIAQGLIKIRRSGPSRRAEGAIRSNARMAQQAARGDFFLQMGGPSAQRWGELMAAGERTEQDLRSYLADRASEAFPHLRASLRAGQSMRDIFSEHVATIAEELEFDPDQLNLMEGKWRRVLDVYDPKLKGHRSMTLHEARTYARQDDRWWHTQNGRAQDASMASFITRIFGERA